MRYILLTILAFSVLDVQAQESDDCHNCVYSVEVRDKLKKLYDDRANAYYNCYYQDEYTSVEWASVSYLEIYSGRQNQLVSHIGQGISLDSITSWYREVDLLHNVLAIKYDYVDYHGRNQSHIITYNELNNQEFSIDQKSPKIYATSTTYNKGHKRTSVIMLPKKWHSQPLSNESNALINYVDCMISNCTSIYNYSQKERRSVNRNVYDPLLEYIDIKIPEPIFEKQKGYTNDLYSQEIEKRNKQKAKLHESQRRDIIISLAQRDSLFLKLYREAVAIWHDDKIDSEDLESIVELVGGPRQALQMKRGRRVMGSCSMDIGPTNHLKEIARLSALSSDWDIFIKSHMNVINDRFDAAVYSSYGEASRNTPIHDFEAIGLEPDKLFIGSLMQASDTKAKHYVSNASRIARAISQLSDPNPSIRLLIQIIRDESTDIPNRINAWYTLLRINRYNEKSISKNKIYDLLHLIKGYELSERLVLQE